MFNVKEDGKCVIDGSVYNFPAYGTYPLKEKVCYRSVKNALEVGYQIFDTATAYSNFHPISQALRNKKRDSVYLISKVWHDAHAPFRLHADLQKTLTELQIDYLDAYLLHWPNKTVMIDETMEALEAFKKQGLIRHIGVSNVAVSHLLRLAELGFRPLWVQVEMSPFFCDFDLLQYCQDNQIGFQAWAPIGRGRVSKCTFLSDLGNIYSKNPAQIALKWIVQHGCLPLAGSSDMIHIQQNLNIHDFVLTEEDMAKIDERARSGKRERFTQDSVLGIADEFDFSVQDCWPVLRNQEERSS